VWSVRINIHDATAVYRASMAGQAIRLGQLLLDSSDRQRPLGAMVLMIERDRAFLLMPPPDTPLISGDTLLLAGSHAARSSFDLTVENANALEYVLSGQDSSSGWLWRQMCGRRSRAA
jgi:uncharacterized protein with PhoU and TrkA domain